MKVHNISFEIMKMQLYKGMATGPKIIPVPQFIFHVKVTL